MLCARQCCNYYISQQTGNGLPYFQGRLIQRGNGFFSNIFRSAVPLLSQVGHYLGKQFLKSGIQVASDVIQGQNFKTAAKSRLMQMRDKIAGDVVDKMQSGSGRKRRANTKKKIKKRRKDIFS